MLFNSSFTAAAIAAAATLAVTGAFAQEGGTPLPPPKVNAITQKVLDNPDLTEPTKGIRTLQDYIVQEKEMWEFLFQNLRFLPHTVKTAELSEHPLSQRADLNI